MLPVLRCFLVIPEGGGEQIRLLIEQGVNDLVGQVHRKPFDLYAFSATLVERQLNLSRLYVEGGPKAFHMNSESSFWVRAELCKRLGLR